MSRKNSKKPKISYKNSSKKRRVKWKKMGNVTTQDKARIEAKKKRRRREDQLRTSG